MYTEYFKNNWEITDKENTLLSRAVLKDTNMQVIYTHSPRHIF